jgi:uncharacterized protein (TIGR03084 family)
VSGQADRSALLADLIAEQTALRARIDSIGDSGWAAPTPAEGWDVRDCVSHLCYFNSTAHLALTDQAGFALHCAELLGGTARPDVELGRSLSRAELLVRWAESLDAVVEAAEASEPDVRVPWYGKPMSVASFITARVMETWAHGQDVVDACALEPVISPRLRHVCHIGVAARGYAYNINGLPIPQSPLRVEVLAPDSTLWTWGPVEAPDRVEAEALDLALIVTRRRHPDDTGARAVGAGAQQWLTLAQAFAGPPGHSRSPGVPVVNRGFGVRTQQ